MAAYSGQTDRTAEQLEDRLRDNQIKALVATSALGMGYDKPDLAFCIHLGSPASPVAYYQQVGRAGRALDDAVAVLVPAETDERIWDYFATAGIPDEAQVERVLDALGGDEPQTLVAVETATGIRRGRLETLLKILAVDDAVERRSGGWVATGQPWYFDEAKWTALRQVRAAEADLMRAYAHGEGCLMQFLQQALDDPEQRPCGRCSVCTGDAAGARAAAVDRDRGGRPPVLPRPGRGGRAAQAVGRAGCPTARAGSRSWLPAGRSRSPTTRPGASSWPSCGGATGRPRRRCWTGWSRC